MTTDEAVLFQRWTRRRDAEAFAQLASNYAGLIYGTCRRVLGNATEAEEVAQECLLTLAQTSKPPRENLAAWLHRVAINKSRDRMKSESRRRAREVRYVEEHADDSEPKWNEIEPLIDQAIAELPEELRYAIVAHFIEGKPQTDVAEALKVSRQTVTYRVAKGVEQIRAALQRRGVHAGVSLLTAGLAANMVEAAPAGLVAAIGKVAVSGGAGAVAATGIAALIPGVKVAAVALVLVAATVAVWNWPRVPKTNSVIAPPAQSARPAEVASIKQNLSAVATSTEPIDPAKLAANSETNWSVLSGVVLEPDGRGATARPESNENSYLGAVSIHAVSDRQTVGHNVREGDEGRFVIPYFKAGEKGHVYASILRDYLVSNMDTFELVYGGKHRVELPLRPGARVSGTLVDAEGQPIPEAWISARWEDGMDMRSFAPSTDGRTDAQGNFVIGPLMPGRFVLRARGAGEGREWRFDSAVAEVAVGEGESVSGVKLAYTKKWDVIDGHVFDVEGRPLADEVVYAEIETDIGVRVSGKTDVSGYFSLPVFAPNKARVRLIDRRLVGDRDEVRVDAGQRDLELTVYDKYSIRGRVTNRKTGEPLEIDMLYNSTGTRTSSMPFKMNAGRFEATYSGPVDTTLIVQAKGSKQVAQAVSLTQGVNEVNFQLDLGDAVSGTVVDEEGRPVANASVVDDLPPIMHMLQEPIGTIGTTDENGVFTIFSLDAAMTEVVVVHENFVPATVPVVRDREWKITLARGGSVEGKVIVDGLPKKNHEVRLDFKASENRLWTPFRRVQTDSFGKFVFTGLMAGTGKVIVQAKPTGGESEQVLEKEVALGDEEHVAVDFDFERINTLLTGRVIAEQSALQGTASLDITSSAGGSRPTGVQIGSDGAFRFDGAPEGYGELRVTLEGVARRTRTIPVRIASDQSPHVDVRFAKANATVKGQVLLGKVEPRRIEAELTIATPEGQDFVRTELATPNAAFELSGLPAGQAVMEVQIDAERASYSRQYEFQLRPDAATVQDIAISNTSVTFEVEGLKEGEYCRVIGWAGEVSLPDFKQMNANDVEAYFKANHEAFNGQANEPILAIEPGSHTVLIMATDPSQISNEDEIMAHSRLATAKIEVPESGEMSISIALE